jgi:hypothetical protein
MLSFEVTSWKTLVPEDLELGNYLWILHADKIPPHIGISRNGRYFSLKVSGKDENLPCAKILQVLEQKKIPCLVVKTSENSFLKQDIAAVFEPYTRAEVAGATCLTPITEIYFAQAQNLILSELLNLLNESGTLEEVFGLHLDENFKGIPYYEREDIQHRLKRLNDIKRTKNIPEGH